MRRSFLFFASAAAAAPLLAAAQDAPKASRVVVQMSDADPARWNLVLLNLKNLQEGMGGADKVTVEMVVFGPGIGMVKADAATSERVAEAVKAGVSFKACENTMRNMKLAQADMNPAIGYVPAGVVHIVRRQQEGWAYLRP